MPPIYHGRSIHQEENVSLRMPETPITEKRILSRLIQKGSRETGIGAIVVDDFHNIYHQKIFQAYLNVIRDTNEFDEFTILNEAKLLTGQTDRENQRLSDVFRDVCTTGGTPNLDDDISNLKLYTKKRKLKEVSLEALEQSKSSSPDIGSLIETLTRVKAGNVKVKSFNKVVNDTLELLKLRWQRHGEIMGISSTIPNIDRATGGMMPGETVIIAARPSGGKSSLMIQIALNSIKNNKKVAYFSLEMQEIEVLEKMIAHELNIDSNTISNITDETQKNKIIECLETIKSYPITFSDNIFTLDDILSTCWYLKETTGLDLVIIDYLQLINPGNKKFQSDNSAVSHISRQLKEAAQQLGVPILFGSQLNRRTDFREDQSPRLSDLRESGSLEQDASIVMALHYHEIMEDIQKDNGEVVKDRDGISKQKSTGKWDTTGILLLKNRRGRANFEVPVMFDRPTSTFNISEVDRISEEAIKIFSETPNQYVD